jgi:hypothetical protein
MKFELSCLPSFFPDKLIGPVALVFSVMNFSFLVQLISSTASNEKISVCSVSVVLIELVKRKSGCVIMPGDQGRNQDLRLGGTKL